MDRIEALRLFIEVADAGSFSAVGRQRVIATSTVALAVKQLETETGVQLITRSTRRQVFTPDGEVLLTEARRIVSSWDDALTGLRSDGPLSGSIRVTATNDFGRHHLRPLLDTFQTRHPDVFISLLLNDRAQDLIEDRLDLAVRSGPLPDSNLQARLLVRGPRRVCASPRYWDAHGRPSHPHDLQVHNCLVLARSGAPISTWSFRDGRTSFGLKVRGDREASDGDVLRQWALEGVGVILKNEWDILADLKAGRLETVVDDFVGGTIDLFVVHPEGSPTRQAAALIDHLVEGFRPAGP